MTKLTECKKCGRTKTWSGDDITCPFQDNDKFGENWNCGIITKLREICYKIESGLVNIPETMFSYSEQDKFVILSTYDILSQNYYPHPVCLFMSWYKDRGETTSMWLLFSENEMPVLPTYQDLELIVNYYDKYLKS